MAPKKENNERVGVLELSEQMESDGHLMVSRARALIEKLDEQRALALADVARGEAMMLAAREFREVVGARDSAESARRRASAVDDRMAGGAGLADDRQPGKRSASKSPTHDEGRRSRRRQGAGVREAPIWRKIAREIASDAVRAEDVCQIADGLGSGFTPKQASRKLYGWAKKGLMEAPATGIYRFTEAGMRKYDIRIAEDNDNVTDLRLRTAAG